MKLPFWEALLAGVVMLVFVAILVGLIWLSVIVAEKIGRWWGHVLIWGLWVLGFLFLFAYMAATYGLKT